MPNCYRTNFLSAANVPLATRVLLPFSHVGGHVCGLGDGAGWCQRHRTSAVRGLQVGHTSMQPSRPPINLPASCYLGDAVAMVLSACSAQGPGAQPGSRALNQSIRG